MIAGGVGSPFAFAAAMFVIVAWGLSGPTFGYSDTWQLIINTGTTIVTFLMVFVIQNTQNRDGRAIQLKLDELIRSSSRARNKLIELEELSEDELDQLHEEFGQLHRHYAKRMDAIQAEKSQRRRRGKGKK